MLKKWTEKRGFRAHETHRMDALNGLPLASFRRRAFAIVIDFMVVAMIKSPFVVLRILFHRHGSGSWWHGAEPESMAGMLREAVEKVEDLAESVVYFAVAMKVGNGKTIGKWTMKIRVVSLTQDRMGWWQSIERALGYGASLLEGGFGFFQYYINRNRQTVHDRIAETIVLYEGKKGLVDPPLPEDAAEVGPMVPG
jgi:uncharacterized RDD family membrane protein YckC